MKGKTNKERKLYMSRLGLTSERAREIVRSHIIKISVVVFCLIFLSGCHPHRKYTTYQEYTEGPEWDHEKGIVKNKASWSVRWDSK